MSLVLVTVHVPNLLRRRRVPTIDSGASAAGDGEAQPPATAPLATSSAPAAMAPLPAVAAAGTISAARAASTAGIEGDKPPSPPPPPAENDDFLDDSDEDDDLPEFHEIKVGELCRGFLDSADIDFIAEVPYFIGTVRWIMFSFSCKSAQIEECLNRLKRLGIGVKGEAGGIVNVTPMLMQRLASNLVPRAPAPLQTKSTRVVAGSVPEDSRQRGASNASGSMMSISGVGSLADGTNPAPQSPNAQQGADANNGPQGSLANQVQQLVAAPSKASVTSITSQSTTNTTSMPVDPTQPVDGNDPTSREALADAARAIASTKQDGSTPAAGTTADQINPATSAHPSEENGSILDSEEGIDGPGVHFGDALHMEEFEREDSAHDPDADTKIQVEPEKSMEIGTSTFMQTIKSRIAVDNVVELVSSSAQFTFDYLMLVLVASSLACIGLVTNNVVVIVASMLVSPLMGPILAVTFGFTMRDFAMMKVGLFSELVGLLLCCIVGFLGGLCAAPVVGPTWPTPEMWSRASGSSVIVGIAIAIPSGVGVALSVLGNNTSSLVGVAISASLLPPAVNTGILLAMAALERTAYIDLDTATTRLDLDEEEKIGHADLLNGAGWSMLLTIANIACIWVAGIGMFKVKEVAPLENKSDFWATHVPNARAYNTRAFKRDDPEATRIRDILRQHVHHTAQQGSLRAIGATKTASNPFEPDFFRPPSELEADDSVNRSRNANTVYNIAQLFYPTARRRTNVARQPST